MPGSPGGSFSQVTRHTFAQFTSPRKCTHTHCVRAHVQNNNTPTHQRTNNPTTQHGLRQVRDLLFSTVLHMLAESNGRPPAGSVARATERAAAAFDAQARSADRPRAPGYSGAPLVRRFTGTPGPGRRGTRRGTMRQGDTSPLLPSRCSSSCTRRSPAERGRPAWPNRGRCRTGNDDVLWSRSSRVSCRCRFSMFLSRRSSSLVCKTESCNDS